MAKDKNSGKETWASRMKEFGGGNFTFLSEDGETITFIVVGLPELMKGVYKGKEQERIGIPMVTEEGFVLLVGGKRLARRLAKHEKQFATKAFMVRRDGAANDTNAKYPVTVVDEQETFTRLQAIAAEDFEPSMIPDAVAEATKVLQG